MIDSIDIEKMEQDLLIWAKKHPEYLEKPN